MKKFYYLFILTLIFVSCKRDCTQSTKDPETVGSTNEKQFLPYKGYEVFKFLKNNTDTINFHGQNLKTEYQYTFTQEDCSQKIPLENKYIKFLVEIPVKLTTLFRSKLTTFLSGEKVIRLSGEV